MIRTFTVVAFALGAAPTLALTVEDDTAVVPPRQGAPAIERGVLPPLGAPAVDDAAEPSDQFRPDDMLEPSNETDVPFLSPGEEEFEGEDEPLPAEDDAPGVDAEDVTGENDGAPALEPRFDLDALPAPVAALRERLLQAAGNGDLDAVVRLAGVGANATQFSFDPDGQDPADTLRDQSGDDQGYEILAILSEILEAGYVVIDEDTPDALYLWPYFAAVSLDELTPQQRVALFRILTAADLEEAEQFGAYVFYRLGIDADGNWRFFLAGD